MIKKGYWVNIKQRDNPNFEGDIETFEGWDDEKHRGYEFYTHNEYCEDIEGRFWCPDAGYIKEPIEDCHSKSMGFCNKC